MNHLKTFLLMAVLTLLLLVVGRLIRFPMGLLIPCVVIGNVVTFWFSDRLVLKMHRAKEVTEQEAPTLFKMTRNLATKAGMPMPKLYVMPLPIPNAFATGPTPSRSAVAVSPTLVQMLSYDELEGVIAHELAHIHYRDTLIATAAGCLAGILGWLAWMAQWGLMLGGVAGADDDEGGGLVGLLLMIAIGAVIAPMIQLTISRHREFSADAWAGHLTGRPRSLAKALQRIHEGPKLSSSDLSPATASLFISNPFRRKNLLSNLFSTHPSLERRVERLEQLAVTLSGVGS